MKRGILALLVLGALLPSTVLAAKQKWIAYSPPGYNNGVYLATYQSGTTPHTYQGKTFYVYETVKHYCGTLPQVIADPEGTITAADDVPLGTSAYYWDYSSSPACLKIQSHFQFNFAQLESEPAATQLATINSLTSIMYNRYACLENQVNAPNCHTNNRRVPYPAVSYTPASNIYGSYTDNGAAFYLMKYESAVVEFGSDPATCSVSLTPSAVNRGSSSTLSWSATNADTSVYIDHVGYVTGSSGSFSVSPSTTTNYRCYAQGSGGTDGWHDATLTVYQPCSWNGGSISSGAHITAYQSDSVPYGNSCVSQTRTCTDGTLSGTYAYASCSVSHQSCTLSGVTVAHGESHAFYSSQTAPVGNLCSSISQSRTCTDGTLSGSASYQYASCTCAPIYSCQGNDITYTDASCSTETVRSCVAPTYCMAGSSSCLNPTPDFNGDGVHTGHLQVIPALVPPGLATYIYWNVSGVQSCAVTGTNGDSWSGLSGEKTSSPIFSQVIYTLSCVPFEGAEFAPETQSVNIVPIFQEL
jgi:hypothetical protein